MSSLAFLCLSVPACKIGIACMLRCKIEHHLDLHKVLLFSVSFLIHVFQSSYSDSEQLLLSQLLNLGIVLYQTGCV